MLMTHPHHEGRTRGASRIEIPAILMVLALLAVAALIACKTFLRPAGYDGSASDAADPSASGSLPEGEAPAPAEPTSTTP